jgi:hypothetical protein
MAFSSVSVPSRGLLVRMIAPGIRIHPLPGCSHLHLITSVKTLLPNKVPATGTEGYNFNIPL